MTVPVELMRERFRILEQRRIEFEKRAAANGGSLPRSDWWRHEYVSDPYLLGCPDDRLALRFHDVFINNTELGHEGLIGLLPVDDGNQFLRKFTHLLEEYALRGGLPNFKDIPKEKVDYFANGGPIAKRIFAGYVEPPQPFLVKYGNRQFLEPMLREGAIRICPASYYSDADHNAAIQDDEVSRVFCIPTWRERLDGKTYTDIQGHRMEYKDDDVVLPVVFDDYYLYSLCDHIYYRMPTDFGADAALVIRDPVRFTQRVISAFLARCPDWMPLEGPVTYYDPYRDYTTFRTPEMAKPFGYSYQREVRIAFKPKRRPASRLQPQFLNIGPMDDYAELLWA
ncbi:MAG: hypothetical protein WA978_04090 [Sphingopyxis granuli]|uniref:hypothetical protein n=1 Tax=Sphingopyxis granuli TaxID=267128 RepID=UPI003C70CBA2